MVLLSQRRLEMVFEEKKMEVFDKISLVGPIFFCFRRAQGAVTWLHNHAN